MTDLEAEALLKQLSDHFEEPVMPVSAYCKALGTWFKVIEELNGYSYGVKVKETDLYEQGARYAQFLGLIKSDIIKSNLLYRLIYLGEPLRTKMCSKHKGKWGLNDLFNGEPPCECGETGWLPEETK